jgi:hypothetical protein
MKVARAVTGGHICLLWAAAFHDSAQPMPAAYRRLGGGYELHTLQIFTVTAEGISRNSVF